MASMDGVGNGGKVDGRPLKEDEELVPILQPVSCLSRVLSFLRSIVSIPFFIVIGIIGLLFILLYVLTGIGPLYQYIGSSRDKRVLDRDVLLQQNPDELVLLEIPGNVNRGSQGQPYKIMLRITKPTKNYGATSGSSSAANHQPLPPIIMPGGLAAPFMSMAKHQDLLTNKYGFTVVSFDRLGVGLSDPYPPTAKDMPPSAYDVASEMNYVMKHCGVEQEFSAEARTGKTSDQSNNIHWIQIGGSMGTNVATAFAVLYPGRLCGFFNLDGLPHGFVQIQCHKFLKDGPALMTMFRKLLWTGLPRLAMTMAAKSVFANMLQDHKTFSLEHAVATMCREQFFVTTGLEYATLLSCCDLEIAALGKKAATVGYDSATMKLMAMVAPDESVLVNETKGEPRSITNERSSSELGTEFVSRNDRRVEELAAQLRSMAVQNAEDVDKTSTYCNWPDGRRHPVGELIGGIPSPTTEIAPLLHEFERMSVVVMCARDYKGLERDYTQEARNHSAARTSLQVLLAGDSAKSYYYPQLSHLHLWQQVEEIGSLAMDLAQTIRQRQGSAA